MESAEARGCIGILGTGLSPQRGPGAEPMVGVVKTIILHYERQILI